MSQAIIQELTEYLEEVQAFDKDAAQDGTQLNGFAVRLTNIMARSNFLMADYGRMFRQEKKKHYTDLLASTLATSKKITPMIMKDFVDAKCHETGYVYDLAERVSRTCVHAMDMLRTIISSLKNERNNLQYQ